MTRITSHVQSGGFSMVNWHNPHEACAEMKRLDKKFSTSPDSPLHHDNRCTMLHGVTDAELFELLQPVGWE